jgi:hypothetical protein
MGYYLASLAIELVISSPTRNVVGKFLFCANR